MSPHLVLRPFRRLVTLHELNSEYFFLRRKFMHNVVLVLLVFEVDCYYFSEFEVHLDVLDDLLLILALVSEQLDLVGRDDVFVVWIFDGFDLDVRGE